MTIRAWMVIGLLFAVTGLSQWSPACPTYVGAETDFASGHLMARTHGVSASLPFSRHDAFTGDRGDRLLMIDPPVSVAIPLPAGGITGIITLSLIGAVALRQRYRRAARRV